MEVTRNSSARLCVSRARIMDRSCGSSDFRRSNGFSRGFFFSCRTHRHTTCQSDSKVGRTHAPSINSIHGQVSMINKYWNSCTNFCMRCLNCYSDHNFCWRKMLFSISTLARERQIQAFAKQYPQSIFQLVVSALCCDRSHRTTWMSQVNMEIGL